MKLILTAIALMSFTAQADFVKKLKPNPMTCSGTEDATGTPIELKIQFMEQFGQLGSVIRFTIGDAPEAVIDQGPALPLVSEGNLYIQQTIDSIPYNLTLLNGDLETLSNDLNTPRNLYDKTYEFNGSLLLRAEKYSVYCTGSFVP